MERKNIRKIAIFRALQLGDLLCAIPAIRALKETFNEADIYLIGLLGSANLVSRFSKYFAGLIPFPGYPGLPEQSYDVKAITTFISYMQQQNFDLVLQMQGNGTLVNPLMELLGAKQTGGFFTPTDYKSAGDLFIPYPNYGHEIERHLLLMKHIGVSKYSTRMEFPIFEDDIRAFSELDLDIEKGKYVCVHPGSRGSWRQWPTENFAHLANLCIENNMKVVLTGIKEEEEIISAVADKMKYNAVIVAGKTDLGTMAVLLKNAFALISNCTGVSHIAAALQVPGIIISMDGEPHRWAPLDKELFYTQDWLTDTDLSKTETALMQLLQKGNFKQDELHYSSEQIPWQE
jgi:ADP-heptose:LPS heptosyltransferase